MSLTTDLTAAAVRKFTTSTSYLIDQDAIEVVIPTSTPASEQYDSLGGHLAQESHAHSSTTFFPPGASTTGFIISRVIEDRYTLELRWTSFIKGPSPGLMRASMQDGAPFTELDDERATLSPVRFIFPARIVPDPAFIVHTTDTGAKELHLYVVTEAGHFYVLRFDQARLFYALDHASDNEWCEEIKVTSLDGRSPVLVHGVDEGRVIVACSDGFAVALTLAEGAESLIQTELKMVTSFSVRSLIPSFSSRSLNSPSFSRNGSSSSQTQVLSMASSSSDTASFAFAVSRDRKLKIWNLDSGLCLKSIDLPKPASLSSSSTSLITTSAVTDAEMTDSPSTPQVPKPGMLLPSTLQHYVKLVAGSTTSPFPSYLALFVPATSTSPPAFFLYGIATDESTGALSELTPVGEKVCNNVNSGALLVDYAVEPIGLSAADADGWALWATWEQAGECEVRCIALPEIEGVSAVDGDDWVIVDRGTTAETAKWTTAYFDDLLEGNPRTIAQVFLDHISLPGRYSASTLDYALSTYEETLQSELDGNLPQAFSEFYDTALERAQAVVGSHVKLEQSPQTGAYLHDQHDKRIKMEWLRFVAMLNESRATALFPLSMAVDAERRIAFVVAREAVSAPIVQETALVLQHLARVPEDADERRVFLNLSPESLEGTYPHLAQRGFRSDILTIVDTIHQLEGALSASAARNLETALIGRIRTPLTQSIEDLAIDLYESSLEPHVDDATAGVLDEQLRGLLSPEGSFQTLWALLTSSELVRPVSNDTSSPAQVSDFASALLTDSLATSIEARYQLAKGLASLLLFVAGEEPSLIPELNSLVSGTLATLHSLASLRWLAQQSTTPPADVVSRGSDVVERFGDMKVSNSGPHEDDDHAPPVPFSLLDGLLRSRFAPTLATTLSSPLSLIQAAAEFLNATGLISQKRMVIDSAADVEFAMRLRQLRLPAIAIEFVNFYPKGAGMLYVRGLAHLDVGMAEEAQADLARAAPALYDKEVRFDENSGISRVLPYDIAGSLGRFYKHVVALFVENGNADDAVAFFAPLAIEALAEEGVKEESIEKDLWLKLFRSHAVLGQYEEAYTTLMAMPYRDTRSACLAHLISVMCENGQVDALTRYSFAGLEADLERNLAFRARNSDPLAVPNYYKILYAFYISKGDLRSAATIMFQQARRIGEVQPKHASFRELATLQCQSYLAAVNALSLVAEEHAWIAVVSTRDGTDRAAKRRKIIYKIPDEEFEATADRPSEIVDLVDLRREYTVALARLQLSEDFPELERLNISLESDAVVALFSQVSRFEESFTAARTLDVDLASVFESLAEKCVALSLHRESADNATWVALSEEALTWEGSTASRAWRLLERHLERHDTDGTFRYRLVVLERALAINGASRLPAALTNPLLAHDPHALIRTMIKFDRLDEAFQYSLKTVKSSPTSKGLASTCLPYSLFDQLLAMSGKDSTALSDDVLRSRQGELRSVLDAHLASVQKVSVTATKAGR